MSETPNTETRESDFDGEVKYLLFDEFMAQVDAGTLTLGEAIENYSALMRLGVEGLRASTLPATE